MNISLPKALEDYVRAKVESGRYASASEVIRESLRQSKQREERADDDQAELRRRIRKSLAELDAGEFVEGEAFEKQLRERNRARPGE